MFLFCGSQFSFDTLLNGRGLFLLIFLQMYIQYFSISDRLTYSNANTKTKRKSNREINKNAFRNVILADSQQSFHHLYQSSPIKKFLSSHVVYPFLEGATGVSRNQIRPERFRLANRVNAFASEVFNYKIYCLNLIKIPLLGKNNYFPIGVSPARDYSELFGALETSRKRQSHSCTKFDMLI